MGNKVVCAITIGDYETKTCETYWLREDDYDLFTEILREELEKKYLIL